MVVGRKVEGAKVSVGEKVGGSALPSGTVAAGAISSLGAGIRTTPSSTRGSKRRGSFWSCAAVPSLSISFDKTGNDCISRKRARDLAIFIDNIIVLAAIFLAVRSRFSLERYEQMRLLKQCDCIGIFCNH